MEIFRKGDWTDATQGLRRFGMPKSVLAGCPCRKMVYSRRIMKGNLLIHGCWALAAIVAFSLGWQSSRPVSGISAQDENRSSASLSRAALGEAGADSRNNRTGNRASGGPTDSDLEGLFGKIVSGSSGLESLAAQALRDPNPITRRLAFSRLLEALTPENAETIRSQMVALGADADQWRDFHYSWGAISGKAAIDHAGKTEEQDLAATMTGWAAANPSEALAMLDNLPQEMEGQREELVASIVMGLTHRDATLATDLVFKLEKEGNGRAGNLMEIVAKEALRAQGVEQASVWADSLPDGPLKGTAMRSVADSYVRKNPQAAAKWGERFADKDYAAGAIEQIGGRWAESDPVAAVNWLENLPAGSGQKAGLSRAFGDWEDRDPAAAGEYLLAMPNSAKRDSAISGFATGYAWQNPQLAIAWAQDIQDPALRQSSLTRAGQAYFRRDPNGAKVWMESSGLSPEAQQQIINGRR